MVNPFRGLAGMFHFRFDSVLLIFLLRRLPAVFIPSA